MFIEYVLGRSMKCNAMSDECDAMTQGSSPCSSLLFPCTGMP